ncbi:electron transfer flavoprotein subunit alpha/FixB family protein [Halocatena salina]|uniref:Electron transfer flavoprotein subunit alpha/FixB family protein n=1 Tax=Halocatena salina TaxID=2934340 RepID=A0A8U0A424_9EURY|nr:electron transfer flavoprotein subunit alpha/FixB family protein [Halocatena salina]UPM43559.1 electron transfer flavoprotein subunit alpha/FixB family protein [Halocatena salina]
MAEIDPSEYTIAELGPEIKEIEDVATLEEILEIERNDKDRQGAKTLLESRIEKFSEDDDTDGGDLDLTEMSVADLGNALQDIDEMKTLESLLERETDGQNRDSAIRLIENRIDSVAGSDEADVEQTQRSPEEKYPELDHPTADKAHVRALENGTYRDMWVYCETQSGALLDVSKEMLGKARRLMDEYNDSNDTDERVVAVVIGDDIADLAEETIGYGADVAVYYEDDRLDRFRHTPYTEIFADMARSTEDWRDYDEPRYTLFPATNNGRDLSAQVQAELDSGLASDCSGLYIEESVISNPVKTGRPGENKTFKRVLHMKRPDFSGFEYSTILCLDNPAREFHPQGASVIPGSFELPEFDGDRNGQLVEHEIELDSEWLQVEVVAHDRLDTGVDLSDHDVIVALGRGIGDDPTQGMELGVELADAFEDAGIGVSRGIVTGSYDFAGHVEEYTREERQIGETGQIVAPKLYIAAGISGAIQHKVGMDESETIIAVNTDPDARIRDFSDYFIEGDLFEVLPQLTAALKAGELDLKAVADGGVGADARGDTDE